MKKLMGRAVKALVVVLVVMVALGGFFLLAADRGWLSPFGVTTSGSDTQVIQAVERTKEVSLVSLSVQGLKDESQDRTVFGQTVPGSEEKVFLQYDFTAKLGFDASDVAVEQTGDKAYTLSIPEFSFIGYAQPSFKVATTDGGVLSFVTPDIDEVEMVNEILSEESQQAYLADNEDLLRDQTAAFYESLFTSIDPDIETTLEFSS